VYTKEPYDTISGSGPNGWDSLAKKRNKRSMTAASLDNMQKSVYRAVHEWRDRVAREEDESTQYVMPNRYLFKLAEAPPGDVQVLWRMLGDGRQQLESLDVVKRRGKELVEVMKRAVRLARGRCISLAGKQQHGVSMDQPSRLVSSGKQQRLLDGMSIDPPTPDSRSSLFVHEDNHPAPSLLARKSTLFGDITFNKDKDGSTLFQKVLMKMVRELNTVPEVPKVSLLSLSRPWS